MAVGVNHAVDEVGIVEGGSGAIERRLAELPSRRPELPQQAAQRATIGRQTGASPFGVEVPLIPERTLPLR